MPLLAQGEVSGSQVPGAMTSKVGLVSRGAPVNGAEESRHRRAAHGWVETVGAGT
ncbi:hypothetical protein SynA15127_02444 [Synechococcus sp. A15-127]|nr:hypothetical protein SynA15127_02444 [Synechococcus sp. A15-127]